MQPDVGDLVEIWAEHHASGLLGVIKEEPYALDGKLRYPIDVFDALNRKWSGDFIRCRFTVVIKRFDLLMGDIYAT